MPSIDFQSIVKRYGVVTVLEQLNMRVEDGEFLVLLGPSGCGKTTLLNLLAGLLDVTDGQISIDGRDVTDLDPKDRGLAMVFQSYALYPTKTVRGNLKFGLSARGLSGEEIERRIAWAAKLLQIDALLDRKPANLSGGQRQRVAIGRALVKQVGVFLFDEPLSNLDAKLRTEMRIEIKRLHNQLRNTVVYVTHDQVEAMTMATKIAVMNRGVIQQFGTPDEIYERPENTFVADFIGAPGMNLIDARLESGALAVEPTTGVGLDLSAYSWRQAPAAGRPIKVGIRPEDITGPSGGSRSAAMDLPVTYFERVGPDAFALLALGERTLSIRIDPSEAGAFRPGQPVPVRLPLDKLSVFDADTGQRL